MTSDSTVALFIDCSMGAGIFQFIIVPLLAKYIRNKRKKRYKRSTPKHDTLFSPNDFPKSEEDLEALRKEDISWYRADYALQLYIKGDLSKEDWNWYMSEYKRKYMNE